MTRRASSEPVTKITLNVFASDYAWLSERHPGKASLVIRALLRNHRNATVSREAQQIIELDLEEIDL